MKRLTGYDEFGNTDIIGVDSMDLQCNLEFDEFNKVTNALNKLAEYEDLEEQCCKENSWGLKMLTEKWKEFIEDIQELYEYRKAEEQGKLLKPKCLPGDYVWEINKERNIISEYEVLSIRYGISRTFRYMWSLRDGTYGDLDGFWDKDIGKTVFLTQQEAEQALKDLEGENA